MIAPAHLRRPAAASARVIAFPQRARRSRDGRGTTARDGAGTRPPSDGRVDEIIRQAWQLHVAGEMSWLAVGELQDALAELREALR
jgi:hypothetical protein